MFKFINSKTRKENKEKAMRAKRLRRAISAAESEYARLSMSALNMTRDPDHSVFDVLMMTARLEGLTVELNRYREILKDELA